MADIFSKKKRSEIMSLIRYKNTKIEVALCGLISAELYPVGYRYRKNHKNVLGKPDIVFVAQKIAIFIDGDFWHGYNLKYLNQRPPRQYWLLKIRQNMERDKKVNCALRRKGWRVLRFWEHEFEKKPDIVLGKIFKAVKG
ncbi:MAG: very short patch repair endonuclease [Candidatus Wolfebacteria bacterium]|nr:very short patch repair endonuclease [Candidatus Wolfebacteria bacterium]